MNIDGLSEATLEKFIARGFIHDFGDIFEIGKHRDEIVEMDGFGEKSFENLMTSLDKAKETTLDLQPWNRQYRSCQCKSDLQAF